MTESTAVALTDSEEFARLTERLPTPYQAALLFRKQEAMFAAALGKTNWGAKVDDLTRRAVAAWARSNDVDATTEIDVLGNRIYLNSRFYYRKLAAMIGAGGIEYAYADHVHLDDRLEQLAKDGDQRARDEARRRLDARIAYNIPDQAKASVVFRIKAKALDREIIGVKWAGGGTRKNDPVGEEHPVESAESRAMRRAMLKLAESVKSETTQEIVATITSVETIEPKVRDALKAFKDAPKALPKQPPPLGVDDVAGISEETRGSIEIRDAEDDRRAAEESGDAVS